MNTVCVSIICSALLAPQSRAQAAQPDAQGNGKVADYQRITTRQRFQWFAKNTIGARSLAVGLFSAAYGTGIDSPREYGPHWDGLGSPPFHRFWAKGG